jgi:CheY-like chemotaxis protein
MSKILVVDDSALSRHCVARLIEQAGHTASTAANGKEAWAMLYAGVPDLIILDLMMPQMDGLTFLRLLRNNHFWNETPVIVLTGHADEEHMLDQARDMGVSDVIFKGTSAIDTVMQRVGEVVQQRAEVGKTRVATRGRVHAMA